MNRLLAVTTLMLTLTLASAASADDRGARIEERFDRRGDRVDDRLDLRGDRIEDRLENRSDRARDNGRDGLADRLDNRGDRSMLDWTAGVIASTEGSTVAEIASTDAWTAGGRECVIASTVGPVSNAFCEFDLADPGPLRTYTPALQGQRLILPPGGNPPCILPQPRTPANGG
jgi:hypothetical protein